MQISVTKRQHSVELGDRVEPAFNTANVSLLLISKIVFYSGGGEVQMLVQSIKACQLISFDIYIF